jgi:uncharacterized membrane protein
MSEVSHSVVVGVPLATVYNQWTQFEDFPRSMPPVVEACQLDDAHVRVVVEEGGRRLTFTMTIEDQQPERHVEWRAAGDASHGGRADFSREGDGARVTVRLRFDDRALGERAGPALARALDGFAADLEARGRETGGWRGKVDDGEVTSGAGG